MAYKKKLTLSIREDLVEEARRIAVERGESLSSIVEDYFEYLVFSRWVDLLAEELGLGPLEPVSAYEVPRSRPRGLDAASLVRELRRGRSRRTGA